MAEAKLLSTLQMAAFVARGFLRLDAVVPDAINAQFLDQIGGVGAAEVDTIRKTYGRIMERSVIPEVPAGTPLADAYAAGSPLARMLAVAEIAGAIKSLVGPGCRFDHHFLHIAFPPDVCAAAGLDGAAQATHQDSTIDPRRRAFDIQLMYFPHAVSANMGGTRFVPGSHLRLVSEAAVARYQNIKGQQHMVCPAGTVLIAHHGLWHGGGRNGSRQPRYMFKIRLAPRVRQERLWDTSDLPPCNRQRPIFWTTSASSDDVPGLLTAAEPWHEADTGRLEILNRIRLWRTLLGDDGFDADYWLTRVENEPQ